MFSNDDIQARLTQFYQSVWSDAFIKVGDVEAMTGGWEAWLFKFSLHTQDADPQAFILRLYHGERDKKAQHEFKAMEGLKRLNYPVPTVYHLTTYAESHFDGSHFMMDFVDGQPLAVVMGEGDTIDVDWLTRYGRLLADLHTLEWESEFRAEFDVDDPYGAIDHFLETARRVIQQAAFAEFAPLVDWIRSHRDAVACSHFSLTHNDFHPDNVLVKDDGSMIVIDWSSMGINDYRNDLAWLVLLEGTYVSRAAGDAILQTYQAVRGVRVENIDVFIVIAIFRRLSDLAEVMKGRVAGGLRPDLIQSMRQDAFQYRACYAWLVEMVDIRLEGIENLLAGLDR